MWNRSVVSSFTSIFSNKDPQRNYDTMIKLFVIENECTEADKRAYERKNVDFSWRVYGAENDILAGEVVDIGEQGFRLIGDVPIEMGESYPFRMEVSLQNGMEKIALEALCVWQSKKLNPGRFTAGFKILNMSCESSHRLREIIAHITASE